MVTAVDMQLLYTITLKIRLTLDLQNAEVILCYSEQVVICF